MPINSCPRIGQTLVILWSLVLTRSYFFFLLSYEYYQLNFPGKPKELERNDLRKVCED